MDLSSPMQLVREISDFEVSRQKRRSHLIPSRIPQTSDSVRLSFQVGSIPLYSHFSSVTQYTGERTGPRHSCSSSDACPFLNVSNQADRRFSACFFEWHLLEFHSLLQLQVALFPWCQVPADVVSSILFPKFSITLTIDCTTFRKAVYTHADWSWCLDTYSCDYFHWISFANTNSSWSNMSTAV